MVQKSVEKAQSSYNEALRHDDTHEKSILALAKLCMSKGELDPCQHHCINLLRMDAANEEASIMYVHDRVINHMLGLYAYFRLADLMFRKNEYEAATFHFQHLLERKPNHYSALMRLILLLRFVIFYGITFLIATTGDRGNSLKFRASCH